MQAITYVIKNLHNGVPLKGYTIHCAVLVNRFCAWIHAACNTHLQLLNFNVLRGEF